MDATRADAVALPQAVCGRTARFNGGCGDEQVHRTLEKRIQSKAKNRLRRCDICGALHVTGGGPAERRRLAWLEIGRRVRSRAWLIQLLCEDKNPSERCQKGIHSPRSREDASPLVRLYLASAAQRISPTNRWDLVAALNTHAEDATDHNLPLMAWFAMEPLVSADMNRALALAVDSKLPRILNFTTRRVAAIGTPEALAAITQTLSRAADDKQRLDILSGLSVALKGQQQRQHAGGLGIDRKHTERERKSEIRALTQSLSLTFGSGKGAYRPAQNRH